MADSLNFDLVSPERSLASFEATSVQIPGSEGDMTAMANHEPVLTTLRPGILSVSAAAVSASMLSQAGLLRSQRRALP